MGGGASFVLSCPIPGSARFRAESGMRPRSYRGWVGGYAIPFLRSCRGTRRTRTLRFPCFAAESARVGTLMSLPEGIATLGSGEVRGGAVSSESDIRVPEAKRGRVPCRNEDVRRPSSRASYINEERSVRIT